MKSAIALAAALLASSNLAAQDLFDSGAATASAETVAVQTTTLSAEATLIQIPGIEGRWAGAASVQGQWLLLAHDGTLYRSADGLSWEKDFIVPPDQHFGLSKAKEEGKNPPAAYNRLISNGIIAFAGSPETADYRISYDGRSWLKTKPGSITSTSEIHVSPQGLFSNISKGWFGNGVSYTTDWNDWKTLVSYSNVEKTIGDETGVLHRANGRYYIATPKGNIVSSRSGSGWYSEAKSLANPGKNQPQIASGNRILVAIFPNAATHSGTLARNAGDGKWIGYKIVNDGSGYSAITFDRGRFVATVMITGENPGTAVWTSKDALTWNHVANLPLVDGQPWHVGMTQAAISVGIGSVPALNKQTIATGADGFLIPGPDGHALLYKTPVLPEIQSDDPSLFAWNAPSFIQNIHASNYGATYANGQFWAYENAMPKVLQDGAWRDLPTDNTINHVTGIASQGDTLYAARTIGVHSRSPSQSAWQWTEQDGIFELSSNGSKLLSYGTNVLQTVSPSGQWEMLRWGTLINAWLDGQTADRFFPLEDRTLVMTTRGGLFQSADHKTWTPLIAVANHFKKNSQRQGVAVGNGHILAYAGYSDNSLYGQDPKYESHAHWLETDGTWRPLELPQKDSIIEFAGYRKGLFAVLLKTREGEGSYQTLYTTTDGKTWQELGWLDTEAVAYAIGEPGLYLATKEKDKALLIDLPTAPETKAGHSLAPIAPKASAIPPVAYTTRPYDTDFTLRNARDGNATALETLAKRLAKQDLLGGYVENPEQAEIFFKQAIDKGQNTALPGYIKLLRSWRPSRLHEIVPYLNTLPENPEAAYLLAAAHANGQGAEANTQSAIQWLEKAVALGRENTSLDLEYLKNKDAADNIDATPEALYAVAQALNQKQSEIAPISKSRAFYHYWLAGGKGHAPSMLALVNILTSDKVPTLTANQKALLNPPFEDTNDKNVRLWIDEGAKAKEPTLLRFKGQQISAAKYGYVKDDALVFSLIQEAAKLNELEALKLLGECYARGIGVAKDDAQAKIWFQKAVDAGHPNAAARITELDTLAQLASETAPQDGKAANLKPKVLAALQTIQDSEATSLKEAELISLFQAVWADAVYDADEADLAQELAALQTGSSLTLTDTAAATLTFTKPLDATVTPGFTKYFPTPFNPNDLQYMVTTWPARTAGPLLYFHRAAKAANNQYVLNHIVNSLAQTALEAGQKDGAYSSNPTNFIATVDDYLARANVLDETEGKEFKAIAYQACQLVNQRIQNRWTSFFSKLK